jgi:hypothetical protein
MSFVPGNDGEFYILDQVNARIQVFKNNKRIRTIPIKLESVGFDFALLPNNKIVIMDNWNYKIILIMDESGKVLTQIKLEGGGVSDARSVKYVYVMKLDQELDGVRVAVEGTSVRLFDIKGNPDLDRPQVWGSFTHIYNKQMLGKILGHFTAQVSVSDLSNSAESSQKFPVYFDMSIASIFGLEDDQNGNIYLGIFFHEVVKDESVFKNIVTIFGPDGVIEKHFEIFLQTRYEMIDHQFRVSPDGKVYYMALDDQGLCIRMYDPWK